MPRRQPNIIFILLLVAFSHTLVTSFAQEDDGVGDPPLKEFIWSVAWSPDRSKVAVGMGPESCNQENNDYSVRLIEPVTLSISDKLNFHNCPANSLEWSGNSQYLISSGGGEGETVLWDMATNEPRLSVRSQTAPHRIYDNVWSPSNAEFATIHWGDSHITFWNAVDGALLFTLDISTLDPDTYSEPTSLAWSPDDQEIAVGTDTGRLMVLNRATGVPRVIVNAHESVISSVQWEDNQIATAGWDNTIRIWNSETGNPEHTLLGHTDLIQQIVWQADINAIASASNDGTVRVWNPLDGTQIGLLNYPGKVWAVDWSPDGSQLVYGGVRSDDQDAEIVIADAPVLLTTQPAGSLTDIEDIRALSLHPDGQIVAIGGRVNNQPGFWLYNLMTGNIDVVLTNGNVGFISWSPDGTRIASDIAVGNGTTFQIFDVTSKQLLASFEQSVSPPLILWDSDSSRVATTDGTTIYIRDAGTGNIVMRLSALPTETIYSLSSIAWDHSINQRIYGLVGGEEKKISVWSTATGELIEQHLVPFRSESFVLSPDFTKLAVGSLEGDGSILILDASNGASLVTLQGDPGEFPQTLVWHPNSTYLATYGGGSRGGVIRIWDITTGQQIHSFLVASVVPFDTLVWASEGGQLMYSTGHGLDEVAITIPPALAPSAQTPTTEASPTP